MKKFLSFPLMAILVTNAYANSSIDTVKQIVSLAESGDIFNLTKTAEKLNLKVDKILQTGFAKIFLLALLFTVFLGIDRTTTRIYFLIFIPPFKAI